MKFCKNLQRLVEISDPEWAPYWTNYRMLKKVIKSCCIGLNQVPPNSTSSTVSCLIEERNEQKEVTEEAKVGDSDGISPCDTNRTLTPSETLLQRDSIFQIRTEVVARLLFSKNDSIPSSIKRKHKRPTDKPGDEIAIKPTVIKEMGANPGEITFFKLLHSELKKAIYFFGTTVQEFIIRERRVRDGVELMKQNQRIMLDSRWSVVAKSLYRLYKDLMLLETFAIMTYCSFSKILKKHDKVTGFNTRNAFMENVVSKANFTNYPKVLTMINSCERLFEEVSEFLVLEGKQCLNEDETLFLNMINNLNKQVLGAADIGDVPRKFTERIEKSPKPCHLFLKDPNPEIVQENEKVLIEENEYEDVSVSSIIGFDENCDKSKKIVSNYVEIEKNKRRRM